MEEYKKMNRKIILIATSIIIISLIVVTIFIKKNKTSEHLNNNSVEDSKIEISNENISKPKITLNPKNDYKEYDIEYETFKGIESDILLKNCYSLYSTYWLNEIKNSPDLKQYFQKIVDNPQNDIKLKKISTNIAIIERTSISMSYDNLVRVDDIWIFKNDTWKLFEDFSNVHYRTELIDLNGDEFQDALIIGGCCDNETCNVLIGNKDSVFINTQDINYYGSIKVMNEENKVVALICKPYEGDNGKIYKLFFDIQKNFFIEQ